MQSIQVESGNLRAIVDAVDRRFMDAMNAGDVAGAVQATYTADARILPPGAGAVQGRDNIAAFWQATGEQLGIRSVELRTVELQQGGDYAWQVGSATLTLADGQSAEGKYIVVWKRENGEWRWHQDIWNLDA
jgi:ketosteroid isomerase-like protein